MSAPLTASQLDALRILAAHERVYTSNVTRPGNPPMIHSGTAMALEDRGFAASHDVGRIAEAWVYTITRAGRAALAEAEA